MLKLNFKHFVLLKGNKNRICPRPCAWSYHAVTQFPACVSQARKLEASLALLFVVETSNEKATVGTSGGCESLAVV